MTECRNKLRNHLYTDFEERNSRIMHYPLNLSKILFLFFLNET